MTPKQEFEARIASIMVSRGWHDNPALAMAHAQWVSNIPGLFATEEIDLECPKPQT